VKVSSTTDRYVDTWSSAYQPREGPAGRIDGADITGTKTAVDTS
jgi:hypothetical protein